MIVCGADRHLGSRAVIRRLAPTAAALLLVLTAGCSSEPNVASSPNPSDGVTGRTAPRVGAPPSEPGTTVAPVAGTSGQIADVKGSVKKVDTFAAESDAEPTGSLDNPWLYDPEQPQSLIPRTFMVKQDRGERLEVYTGEPPSESTTWIRRSDVDIKAARYRIEVSTGTFNLKVFEDGKVIMDAPIAVGTGQRPTLTGLHFLNVLLQNPNPDDIYGPYAYGLSSYSTDQSVLEDFKKGQAAIHGTNDPSSIGRAVSNGCIRLSNENITTLAQKVPPGTPVLITA